MNMTWYDVDLNMDRGTGIDIMIQNNASNDFKLRVFSVNQSSSVYMYVNRRPP